VEAMAKKYGIKLPGKEEYVSTLWINDINAANMAANGNVTKTEDEITYSERWRWEELEGRKRAQARKNGRGRTCGFCGEGGHNSRTCPDKKQHVKDCNAMQGLAHRVVAACLEKAGIVPGALMRYRDWCYKKNEYVQGYLVVSHIDWSIVGDPGYDCSQGLPRGFENWLRKRLIVARNVDGKLHRFGIPRNIEQQSHYDYYEKPSENEGLASPLPGGKVNKDNGWAGDNHTLISPGIAGIYRFNKEGLVDKELNKEVSSLIVEAGSKWAEH
jgi:hypothetical protein